MLGATNPHIVAVARIALPLMPGGAAVYVHVSITDYVLVRLDLCAHIHSSGSSPISSASNGPSSHVQQSSQ